MKKTRNGMRITGLLLTMVMLVALLGAFSMTASAAAAEDISVTIDTGASITLKDTDGDGAYEIGNADELYAFAAAVNGGSYSINGELTANIVVNEGVLDEMAKAEPDTARFREWMPIGYYYILDDVEYDVYFLGTFDGNGKTVNGLYVNDTDKYSVGLFGQIGEGATVETVGVIDSYFCGNEFIGGVVGYNEFGTVTNCYNMGNVSGKLNVGGVIGANNYGNVTNCYNTGVVNGTEWIGGAVGYNYGTVEKCYNIGGVSGMSKVGGVLGGNDKLVTSCYYLAGTANGGIDSADISGQAEVKDDTWFAEYPICRVVGFGHEWADGSCTACGYVCIHDGEVTPATCQKQAVCETCGESYGELAEDNHNFDEFNTCVCGVKNFHIYGQQLNVGGDLSMKYYVTAFGDGVSTETLKMKFNFLGKETVVDGIYNAEMGMYVFTLEGINPQCMGDEIDAYLLLDGEEKANKLDYTVEENLLALREKYKDDTALVALVNDILAYGSAASEYKGYGSMTDDYVSSDREIPTTNVAPSDAFTGYTVTFGQMNYIKIRVNLADGNTLYLGETDITNELVDGIYKTAGIAPTDFDNVFNFTVKNGDETVATFALSVNDYISANKDSESMGKLVKALYNYGVSAEIYNHVANGVGEHTYTYIDNGDGTHDKVCTICSSVNNEAHDYVNGKCVCGKYEVTIDLSTLNATYVINDNRYYEFIGTGSYGIKVESGNPTIVLNNASITVGEGSAIDVASGSNATIFVLGDNTIGTTKTEYSDVPCGGIFVAEGGTVNITSNGTDNILRARGTLAAAIGGKYILYSESYNAGNISISNVTVYAYTNDNYAAAIGAAGRGSCGTINITNAVVYAYGAGDEYTSAPGIGSAWNHVGWSETIPVVIISDSEIHTFRYNPYSDYIGYLGDESGEEGGFHATGSINCGEGGSVKSSTIYCYTGLDATTTDKVVTYDADGNPTEN